MTFKKVIAFGLILWVLLAVLKYLFLEFPNFGDKLIQLVFELLVVAFSTTVVRRLAVLNFLEAMFIGALWALLVLILDLLITRPLVSLPLFDRWQVWSSYGVLAFSVFFFHKKRHIQIRKQMEASGHGHH